MRLRIIRLLVAVVTIALAGAAVDCAAAPAAPPKPVPIVVGHRNVIVKPAFDFSRTVSSTIGSAGGTLTTITADGTTIRLTLPRNALAGDEQVSMTPLTALSGAGVQLLEGVQLAPDGLRLLEPGALDITPAHSAPKARQVAFGYQGGGSQFGLVPLALRSSVEIPLIRLGGAGLARATSAQQSAREAQPPSDIEAAWLAQLAPPLYQLRRHRSVKTSEQQVGRTLSGYWDGFVKPTLRAPGSSLTAWTRATTRSAGWEDEVGLLGFVPRFAADEKQVRTKVFQRALRKRWTALTGSCTAGNATLGHLQTALQLARVAQIRGTGSQLGGSAAITTGITGCAELAVQVTLGSTNSNWQSGQGANYLAQIGAIVSTGPTPLVLEQRTGNNEFAFLSAHVPIVERLTSWTLSTMYPTCARPTFAGFTQDPNQLYASFSATLAVPPDLFVGASAPPALIAVSVSGADLAGWTTTCPQQVSFSQAPGEMAGLSSVTAVSPIRLSSSTTTVKFQGSADILAASTITGFANEVGSVAVRIPR
jgi:hypothetical protein